MLRPFHRDLRQAHWNILCDFDGTIVPDDVVDSLLERYGLAGWEILEQRWRDGHIGSLECMRGQVELLEVGVDELDRYLDSLVIDPDFPEFESRARALGMEILIVSDGLDHVIRRILTRHGLGNLPIIANELLPAEVAGRWRLNTPFAASGCASATCKCAQLPAARETSIALSLLVGDGVSDYCVAGKANFVFAKKRLVDYCRLEGIAYRPIAGFADAVKLLPALSNLGASLPPVKPLMQSRI